MKLEDKKIINLEKEVFKKFGEALDLMKKRLDVRLQLAKQDGMPDAHSGASGHLNRSIRPPLFSGCEA